MIKTKRGRITIIVSILLPLLVLGALWMNSTSLSRVSGPLVGTKLPASPTMITVPRQTPITVDVPPQGPITPEVPCVENASTAGAPEPNAPPKVDVLFLLDSTSSMLPSIDGVKKTIKAFVGEFDKFAMDVHIGLIAFRDRPAGEEPQILLFDNQPFTADVNCFSSAVGKIIGAGGGVDLPESQLDALVLGTRQPFRVDASRKVIILITDSAPKIPDRDTASIDDAVRALQQAKINFLYLFVTQDGQAAYQELVTKSGLPGGILSLMDAKTGDVSFERLLPEIARKVSGK